MGAVETIVVATAEPVSLQQAKTHLRVTTRGDDSRILGLLKSAREWVENQIRRKLCTQTLALYLDGFPCWSPSSRQSLPLSRLGWWTVYAIELPFVPVSAVNSITYFDATNQPVTIATNLYDVDLKSTPARIIPVFGAIWPLTYFRMNAVTITFVVGYAAAIPESAKTAILLKLQELYEGADTANAIESILSPLSPVL